MFLHAREFNKKVKKHNTQKFQSIFKKTLNNVKIVLNKKKGKLIHLEHY